MCWYCWWGCRHNCLVQAHSNVYGPVWNLLEDCSWRRPHGESSRKFCIMSCKITVHVILSYPPSPRGWRSKFIGKYCRSNFSIYSTVGLYDCMYSRHWFILHCSDPDRIQPERSFQTHTTFTLRKLYGWCPWFIWDWLYNYDIVEMVAIWGHWPLSLTRSYSGSTILPPYTHQY